VVGSVVLKVEAVKVKTVTSETKMNPEKHPILEKK